MIPFKDLTEFDFELMEIVSECQPIKIGDLIKKLPKQKAVTLRVELLAGTTSEKPIINRPEDLLPISKENYLHYRNSVVQITKFGEKAIEDNKLFRKKARWKFVLDCIGKIAPLIISLLSFFKSYENEISIIWQTLTHTLR